jgi:SMI1-KNR4 cell-wall
VARILTKDEVRDVIEALVGKYEGDFNPPIERLDDNQRYDPPTRKDWEFLEAKFNTSFGPEFIAFVELITDYNLPGMLNVTREGKTNGDPTPDWWYDREMSAGMWNPDLIPFISVGNGDFFCLSASKGPESGVYYVDHEDGSEEPLTPSFREWLERLEYFLNG